MIWFVFALLTAAALLAVVAPLAFGAFETDSGAADKAFYAEQISEIERERLEGRLADADAEAARREAARRLLRAHARETGGTSAAKSRVSRTVAALLALAAVPAIAVPLYLKIGAVDLADMPLAQRLANTPLHSTLAAAIARIEAHLSEHPDDGRGFEVIAPYYLRNGRVDDAVHALSEALRLLGPTAERHDALGEALVAKSEGRVAQDARDNFEAALKIAPADPMARYYMGLAAAQEGDAANATEIWTKLLADAPPNAPYRQIVSRQLQTLEGEAPNSEAGKVVAAMPEKDRAATIAAMVERLAGRLAQQGDDVEGWLKLIRAYSVLGQSDKASAAVDGARKALAGKAADLERIEALAQELGVKEATRP